MSLVRNNKKKIVSFADVVIDALRIDAFTVCRLWVHDRKNRLVWGVLQISREIPLAGQLGTHMHEQKNKNQKKKKKKKNRKKWERVCF